MANVFLYENEIRGTLFQGNIRDITSNATANKIYDFKIVNNDFVGSTSSHILGIRLNGESSFHIFNNRFSKINNISLVSTGNRNNEIKCNDFLTGAYASTIHGSYLNGVQAQFKNTGLTIIGNDFEPASVSGIEIKVYGTVPPPSSTGVSGEIAFLQGNSTKSAGNCFSNPVSAIQAVSASTEKFQYYVYGFPSSPIYCEQPTNNASDGGTNNYKLFSGSQFLREKEGEKESDCVEGGKGEKEGKEEEFFAAKILVEEKHAAFEANPEDDNLKEDYYSALLQKDNLLKSLLQWAADEGDYTKIEELLLAENTNEALRQVIGMRTRQRNFEGALELLNSMSINEQDDQWYKDIVLVNFNMLHAATMYELTPEEEEKMLLIASTPQSIMQGYACAILSICKSYTCDINLEGEESFEGEERSISNGITAQVKIFPNPTSGAVNIDCSNSLGETLRLELMDMSGRALKYLEYVNTGSVSFNFGNLPEGMYYIRLSNNSNIIGNEKLTIKR